MDKDIKDLTFSQDTLRIFYITYKDYIIPCVILIVSFLLFIFVVIPQYQDYFSMQAQINDTQQRITALKNNLQTLSSLNSSSVDQDYQVISKALPPEKDFIGVLEAVSRASTNASVSVGDFSFSVGDLSTKSAQLSPQPTIGLTLSVVGTQAQVKDFINQLSQASPIAEISGVDITSNGASLDVLFYYKAIPQSLQVQYDAPLPVLSDKDEKEVSTLQKWQENVGTAGASFTSF